MLSDTCLSKFQRNNKTVLMLLLSGSYLYNRTLFIYRLHFYWELTGNLSYLVNFLHLAFGR
jgi:hypothetical protein